MSIILKAENLHYPVHQDGKEKIILNNISFEVKRNSILGISGESGSGKTTLGRILSGILKPTAGKINYYFKENHKRVSPVQMLFQNTGEIINPLRKIRSMLRIKGEALERLIEIVGIEKELLDKYGYELSGGEQQRVALARILTVKPELLILDEPFSAQDYESQKNLLNLFLSLKKDLNITMICIAHNLKLLRKLADEVIILYNGEIIEMNKTEELFDDPQQAYTKFLIKAEKYDLKFEDFKQ